jgi:transposase
MKNNQFFIGIDVSKPYFDASLMPVIEHEKKAMLTCRFDNNKTGLKTFDKWLKSNKVSFDSNSLVLIENTGVYHRLLWMYCTEKNLPIHIGNAAHIKWSLDTRGSGKNVEGSCYFQKRKRGRIQKIQKTSLGNIFQKACGIKSTL